MHLLNIRAHIDGIIIINYVAVFAWIWLFVTSIFPHNPRRDTKRLCFSACWVLRCN